MRRESIERSILFLCEDNACLSRIAEASAKIESWPAPDEFKPKKGTAPNDPPFELSGTKSTNGSSRFVLGRWRNVS